MKEPVAGDRGGMVAFAATRSVRPPVSRLTQGTFLIGREGLEPGELNKVYSMLIVPLGRFQRGTGDFEHIKRPAKAERDVCYEMSLGPKHHPLRFRF